MVDAEKHNQQGAQDLAIEKITLWQDFTQPNGYRDSLKLVQHPGDKWHYEFSAGGRTQCIPYNHFWKRLE
jgi:hypothetical protein